MALDDFASSTPEEDDLFNFAEVEVEQGSLSEEASTSSSDEEILEAVQRAAAAVQDELGPLSTDAAEEIDEDELVASFPEGMLDDGDDDLFSFDDLLSDDAGPAMDSSIVDDEDRYGLTAQQAAEHLDYTEEEEGLKESSAFTEPVSAEGSKPSELQTTSASSVPEDDLELVEKGSLGGDDLYDEPALDREAEAEEFASLLAEPEAAAETQTSGSPNDEIKPVPRKEAAVETEASPEPSTSIKSGAGRLLERFALHSNSGKPLYLVVGSFLALNLILAVLAIFAFFRVGSGLQGMKTSLAGSLETIAREARQSEERTAQSKVAAQEADAQEAATPQEPQASSGTAYVHLEPRERTEIRAARAEIESGKFETARRRLFQLLAVSDSPLSEEGRIAEEEANLLVAESFEAEAHAYIETQARLREEAMREQRP